MSDKLILPVGCEALTGDELTYTEGGSLVSLAAGALFVYNYAWGLNETRNWLKKNKTGSAVSTAIKAYGDTVDYISSSIFNTVRGVITAMQFSALWPITAVAWLTVKATDKTASNNSSAYSSVTSPSTSGSTSSSRSGPKVVRL